MFLRLVIYKNKQNLMIFKYEISVYNKFVHFLFFKIPDIKIKR